MAELIIVDKQTGGLELQLPAHAMEHSREAVQALAQEFSFETVTEQSLNDMNAYLTEWFTNRGIAIEDGQ